MVAEMVNRILELGLPGLDDAERARGYIGIEIAIFGAQRLVAGDHQVAIGPGPEDPARERVVCLFVDRADRPWPAPSVWR